MAIETQKMQLFHDWSAAQNLSYKSTIEQVGMIYTVCACLEYKSLLYNGTCTVCKGCNKRDILH